MGELIRGVPQFYFVISADILSFAFLPFPLFFCLGLLKYPVAVFPVVGIIDFCFQILFFSWRYRTGTRWIFGIFL
jgi:hypothetical protein